MSDTPFQPLGRDIGGIYEAQRCLWKQLQRLQTVHDLPSGAALADVTAKVNEALAILRTITRR